MMNIVKSEDKTINRRIAFRIYEKINLFYHKIDPSEVIEPQGDFTQILNSYTLSTSRNSPIDQSLPESQSQENDTRNANISTTGIAFTSKDELQAGDYLMIRIFLLSSMTVIMSCCKVVYCKPSNPFEIDRYPYLIGAQFINLTTEDTAILHRHVSKQKNQQLIFNGLLIGLAISFLAMPDVMFGLLVGVAHHLLELVLHVMHLGFEFVEYNLDHLIEHTLHTDLHTTQVIAFYTLFALGLGILYVLWRFVPPACRRLIDSQISFWTRKKASFLYFWGEQTTSDKVKIVGASVVAIAGYIYFGM